MSVRVRWRDEAVCGGLSPRVADAVFFPVQNAQQRYARAQWLCARCPVRGVCLAAALAEERGSDTAHLHGMRGGLTPGQRGALLRAEREVAA